MNRSAAFLSAVVAVAPAIAAEPSDRLERVVVTGTRTPTLLHDSPVKVDVVEGEEIARLSKGTLRQVLEVMPGVVVRRNQKDGYNVQMGGFNGDHVLVLINGQPVISPTGSSVDLDQISVNNIRQIEIVRGAASVLYGSSAMGGVINIITDTPEGSALTADYEVSAFPGNAIDDERWGHTAKINASTRWEQWRLGGSVQHIANPGFEYDPDTVVQNGGAVDKDFATLSVGRHWDDLQIRYNGQWFEETKNKPQSAIPGQNALIQYQSDVTQWQHDFRIEKSHQWHVNGRYLEHDELSGNSNGLRQTDILLAELDAQWIVSSGAIEWVAGGVLHTDELDQYRIDTGTTEVDNASRDSAEAYLQANWRTGDTQWLGGLRVQNDSDFGWHEAIKLSISHVVKQQTLKWQWRGGVGSSYRVPNLKERYYVFDHSNLGYMVLGNSALVPETALSTNAGVEVIWEPASSQWQFSGDIELHHTEAEAFITTQLDREASEEAGLDISVYQNLEEATLSGVDISMSARNLNWHWQVHYSYLQTEGEQGKRLTERPRHVVKASVSYDFDNVDSTLQTYLVYEGDVSPAQGYTDIGRDHFTTVNLVYQHHLTAHWQFRAGAENLTDTHRDPALTQSGRWDARPVTARRVYLGFGYRF
ncbi:TonB-dependent receptor plug domain-containing protein [Alteromonas antoniana]|uniref:TonB-dependent receptor plug domain-containing protein n=1 Tax=Alteromonas antoniana TaxID=2803813 RepID=UPI001C494B30